jgi:D-alanyl-D-alanine carboxypeptidase (penicillin-binding protein 5/6)
VLFTTGLAGPAVARVPRPALNHAAAAIVVDSSGRPMLELHPDRRRPIASATKLMTALLVLERVKLDRTFTAPAYNASSIESKIDLRRGERMKVHDLLTALLLESANDAAVTLATGTSGSREAFVTLMNRRARALGLKGTHFANPVGFDSPRNYSTARDLVALARRLMADKRFAAIVNRPSATLASGSHRRTIRNRNGLVARHPFVDGIKTGHTQGAGYVLVGAGHGKGPRVYSVVMGEPSEAARDMATLAMLRWGLDQFRKVMVLRPGQVLTRVRVAYHDDLRIPLVTRRGARFTLRRGERLGTRVHAPAELEGPIPKGRRVGSVEVLYLGRPVRRLALVTGSGVPGTSVLTRVMHPLGVPLTALALIIVLVGGLLSAMKLRAVMSRGQRTAVER